MYQKYGLSYKKEYHSQLNGWVSDSCCGNKSTGIHSKLVPTLKLSYSLMRNWHNCSNYKCCDEFVPPLYSNKYERLLAAKIQARPHNIIESGCWIENWIRASWCDDVTPSPTTCECVYWWVCTLLFIMFDCASGRGAGCANTNTALWCEDPQPHRRVTSQLNLSTSPVICNTTTTTHDFFHEQKKHVL